jgi:hypothetical protein
MSCTRPAIVHRLGLMPVQDMREPLRRRQGSCADWLAAAAVACGVQPMKRLRFVVLAVIAVAFVFGASFLLFYYRPSFVRVRSLLH